MKKVLTLTLATMFCLMLQRASMADLIAHYQFDGDLKDSISNSSATTVGTTPTEMFAEGPEGVAGGAVDLSGTDWYIDCGGSLDTGSNALTISTWIYDYQDVSSANAENYFGGIVMRDGYQNSPWGLRRYSLISYNMPGRAQMLVGNTGSSSSIYARSDNGSVPSGQWVHLAATYGPIDGGSQIKLYINGTLAATTDLTTTHDISSTQNILIGYDNQRGGDSAYFDGLIADVRIYNETLDGDAISTLASPVPEPGTVTLLLMAIASFLVWKRR